MIKIVLLASVTALVACSSMAQGIMTLTTSGSTHPIEYSLSGDAADNTKVPIGNPAQIPGLGSLNVAIFSTTAGTVLTVDAIGLPNFSINGWAQASTIVHSITFTAGTLGSTTETLANAAPNSPVQLEVVGWTGTATTWTQAEANYLAGTEFIGFSGDVLSGGAFGWTQNVGSSSQPGALVLGNTAFNTLVLSVGPDAPEPSTIALGGLAAAALVVFRRRK